VQQLAQGAAHACALEDSGRVACWGASNDAGQLGDGTTDPHAAARTVMEGGRSIAVGLLSSCAVHASGEVSCWGRSGDLIDGASVLTPMIVPDIDDAAAIGGGPVALAMCAVRIDGSVACWGLDLAEYARTETDTYNLTPTTIAGLTDVVSVSVGIRHACAVRDDGSVWCWGGNASGQLGDGTMESRAEPTLVFLP
jgi:alpha-tubulin suppressor-like RCC1 family protein